MDSISRWNMMTLDIWRDIFVLLSIQDLARFASTFDRRVLAFLGQPRVIRQLMLPHNIEEAWSVRFLLKTLRKVDMLAFGLPHKYTYSLVRFPKDLLPLLQSLQPDSLTLSFRASFKTKKSSDPHVNLREWFPSLRTLVITQFWFTSEEAFDLFVKDLPRTLTSFTLQHNSANLLLFAWTSLLELPRSLTHLSIAHQAPRLRLAATPTTLEPLDYMLSLLPKLQSLELNIDGQLLPASNEIRATFPKLPFPIIFTNPAPTGDGEAPSSSKSNSSDGAPEPDLILPKPPALTKLRVILPNICISAAEALRLPKTLMDFELSTPYNSAALSPADRTPVWKSVMAQLSSLPQLCRVVLTELPVHPNDPSNINSVIPYLPSATLVHLALNRYWLNFMDLGGVLASLVNLQIFEEIDTITYQVPVWFNHPTAPREPDTSILPRPLPPSLTKIICSSIVFSEPLLPMFATIRNRLKYLKAPFKSLVQVVHFTEHLPHAIIDLQRSEPVLLDVPHFLDGISLVTMEIMDSRFRHFTRSRAFNGRLMMPTDLLPEHVTGVALSSHSLLPTCGSQLEYEHTWLWDQKFLTYLHYPHSMNLYVLKDHLSNLKHFRCDGTVSLPSYLPDTLEVLETPRIQFVQAKQHVMMMMPSTLRCFKGHALTYEFLRNSFPSTIQEIHVTEVKLTDSEVANLLCHYRALTRFNMTPAKFKVTSDFLKAGHTKIDAETLIGDSKTHLFSLAPKVAADDIERLYKPATLSVRVKQLFPATETIQASAGMSIKRTTKVPEGVTSIEYWLPTHFNEIALPSTITSISIVNTPANMQVHLVGKYLASTPPSLTSFRFKATGPHINAHVKWHEVPLSLQHLALIDVALQPPSADTQCHNHKLISLEAPGGTTWTETALERLAEIPSLSSLRLLELVTNASLLPPTITEIHSWDALLGPLRSRFPQLDAANHTTELRGKLPDSVTSFSASLIHVPEGMKPEPYHPALSLANIFPLPPSLIQLTIEATPIHNFGFHLDPLWAALPPSVTSVTVKVPSSIGGTLGERLPQGLAHLDLPETRGSVTLKSFPPTCLYFRAPLLTVGNPGVLPTTARVECGSRPTKQKKGK